MGIQIHINHDAMLANGCRARQATASFPEFDNDGQLVGYVHHTHQVYDIPGYGEWWSYTSEGFTADFNEWGANVHALQPWLDTTGIEYELY
jgi:hypothetical protein